MEPTSHEIIRHRSEEQYSRHLWVEHTDLNPRFSIRATPGGWQRSEHGPHVLPTLVMLADSQYMSAPTSHREVPHFVYRQHATTNSKPMELWMTLTTSTAFDAADLSATDAPSP